MTALHRAAPELIDAEDEQALFDRTVDIAERVLSFDRSYLLLADEDADRFVFVAGTDDEIDDYPPNAGVLGRTYETGEPELVEDATDHDAARPAHDSTRAAISVPLGDVGVFQALSTEPGAFDETDLHCAELLMAHVAVSLERIRAEAQLRSERDRFEALFENIPGAAIAYEMVGGEPIVRRINEAFERSFGFGEATILDESLDDHIVPPAASEAADEYNDRLERGERVQAEVERRTANGTRHFLLQVIPLEVGAENERGFAIYSDVSDRKQREEELRRQNERLDEFASVVSHDLRNPLSVASGFLELARETGDPAHLDRIERALDRMDDLVTDLLVLAREGRDVGETERVALGEMARTAWANVSTNDGVLRAGTEAEVEADPDRLVALFENLFRNSLEHGYADEAAASSGDGGSPPALTITVDDLTDETGVLSGFVVADDGVGIDADFDPFETGATSTESGTGFGLAIVKSIAEAHGWTVSAGESDSGGARFEFSF